MIYPYRQPFFNEPFDGILYAVVIAMGFATFENVLYASRFNLNALVLRAFTAVPAHASFAVIQGYFIGKAKFKPEKKWKLISMGLLASICLHGFYDFFILQQAYKNLAVLAFFTLSISLYLSLQLIHAHQEGSPFKDAPP
jgi:RsiW-degrading membrane proteinase PrsW (M82 family)